MYAISFFANTYGLIFNTDAVIDPGLMVRSTHPACVPRVLREDRSVVCAQSSPLRARARRVLAVALASYGSSITSTPGRSDTHNGI